MFEAYGLKVPQTCEEMIALSGQIVAAGSNPWFIGVENGGASIWPGWVHFPQQALSPESYPDAIAAKSFTFWEAYTAKSAIDVIMRKLTADDCVQYDRVRTRIRRSERLENARIPNENEGSGQESGQKPWE